MWYGMWYRHMHRTHYMLCISKISHTSRAVATPAMAREPWEAGEAWRAWLLNKIGMTEEEAVADMPLFYDKAREVIRRSNQSGFRDVFKVGEKWQAKVYVGPKDQRHAGYFATPEAAADEVLKYLCTGVPPPKPEREARPASTSSCVVAPCSSTPGRLPSSPTGSSQRAPPPLPAIAAHHPPAHVFLVCKSVFQIRS